MNKAIDTSRVVVFAARTFGSRFQLFFSALGLLVFGGGIILLYLYDAAFVDSPGISFVPTNGGDWIFVIILIVIVVICLAGLISSWRFLRIADNILTITPDGICDKRVMDHFVPWQAVKSVSVNERQLYASHISASYGYHYGVLDLVLSLDPELIDPSTLLKGMSSLRIAATRPWLTFRINMIQLKINRGDVQLYDVCKAYAAEHAKAPPIPTARA